MNQNRSRPSRVILTHHAAHKTHRRRDSFFTLEVKTAIHFLSIEPLKGANARSTCGELREMNATCMRMTNDTLR